MGTEELEKRFQEAVDIAYNLPEGSLAPDVQLRLYAYYKQATFGAIEYRPAADFDLRNAFKTNAWLQISNISSEEAKREYIAMVDQITKKQ
jgi:acyl-CoA-binding protein